MKTLNKKFKFSSKIWLYSGKSAWHFVTLSKPLSRTVRKFAQGRSSAWGSVKVDLEVRDFKWGTSIFPDRKLGAYLLPLKKKVRKALGIRAGDKISGTITVKLGVGMFG